MGISPEIATNAISDGYHDNGIAAIYLDGDNNELYFVNLSGIIKFLKA